MRRTTLWATLLTVAAAPIAAQEAAAVTTYGRTSMAVGGGFMSSAYEITEEVGGRTLWYTPHQIIMWSAVAEIRHEVVRGWDVGLRFMRLNGYDRSGRLTRVDQPGFGPPGGAASDSARTDDMDGESYFLSIDTRYVGITAGVSIGRWLYASDFPLDTLPGERTVPVGTLRIGRFNGWHAEAGYGRHLPALAPRPVIQAGLARGNIDGTRLIRFGYGKEGGYVGGRFVTDYGLDIEPYFAARTPAERQFGIVIKERIRLLK